MVCIEQKGIYCVIFALKNIKRLKIGELGTDDFSPGFYFYCGSAKGIGGISGRINRHLNKNTKRFWHIDYLKEITEPIQVWYLESKEISECDLVKILHSQSRISYGMNGFGSSDCIQGCYSHLLYASFSVELDTVFEHIQDALPFFKRCLIKK